MASHRGNADLDDDIASVLCQHVCERLDREIERLRSILASHSCRRLQQEAHA
jgi:hypothetical protein